MKEVTGTIPVEAAKSAAVLELYCAPAIAAAADPYGGAGLAAAILGLHGDGSAQGVQAVQRVGSGHQRHLCDGDAGNQVPAHHIAEGLVLSHPIHIHGDALRRAQQRRRRVAAVVHVRLEWVFLVLVDVYAA